MANNRWVTQKDPIATWIADLSNLWGKPEEVLGWIKQILQAGIQRQTFVVNETARLGYHSKRDGDLCAWIEDCYRKTGAIDIFWFSGQFGAAAARLAYFAADGTVADAEVNNVGLLLQSLRPEKLDAGLVFMHSAPPIAIDGIKVDFDSKERSEGVFNWKRKQIAVRFSLYTDIWFPWVYGFLEDDCDQLHKRFDNRHLARLHSPRLNAFLSTARSATLRALGTWQIDLENTYSTELFALTVDGVNLDAPLPLGISIAGDG